MKLSYELKKALDTKEKIKAFKVTAINNYMFDFAAEIREFEKEKFPEENTNERDDAFDKANHFQVALAMVDIKADIHSAYRIMKLSELHNKKGDKLTLEDTSKILAEANKYFG